MNRLSIFIFTWLACAALGWAQEPVRLAISAERVSGMKVVPEGIIFYGGNSLGFWLLPAKELEARLQQSHTIH